MPITVDSLPKSQRGRESKYDFSDLFDGKVYILVRGSDEEVEAGKADFTCKAGSLRQTIYRAASEAGHKLATRYTTHDGREAVAIQRTGKADQNGDGDKAEGKAKSSK